MTLIHDFGRTKAYTFQRQAVTFERRHHLVNEAPVLHELTVLNTLLVPNKPLRP